MAEATAPDQQFDPAEFLRIWSDSFSQVLGQITGSPLACMAEKEMPADLTAAAEDDLRLMITSSGGLRGEMSLRLAAASVLRLAQIFMSEPPSAEQPLTADHREAVVELLRQVSGIVSTAAKAHWGDVQLLVEAATAAPSWSPALDFWLRAGDPGPASMVLEFGLSAALVAELRTEKTEAVKTEAIKTEAVNVVPEASSPVGSLMSATGASTLDLLMDVQLAMTLRFGAKTLLLREVLDLSPGTVVELDRKVEEPVELLLDGKLIARGEVVVIEGSYGLRVTEVSSLARG